MAPTLSSCICGVRQSIYLDEARYTAAAVLYRSAYIKPAMIQPLLNATDDEWVMLVGRYILNMGAVEATTRVLIGVIDKTDRSPVMSADLPSRIGYVRKRFPRNDQARHSWAMNVFEVVSKHVSFRNAVAHSPIAITERADGSRKIQGILNLTPNDPGNTGYLITLEELRARVNETAALGKALLEMQTDFGAAS